MRAHRTAFLACGLLLAGALASCAPPTIRAQIGGEEFRLEVARTEEEKTQGLMYRRSLGERRGMIFVYEADEHLSFWMKNTRIPLDLVFLSHEGEVLQIEALRPHSLKPVTSERAARYALELPAGTAVRLGLEPGARVLLPAGFP